MGLCLLSVKNKEQENILSLNLKMYLGLEVVSKPNAESICALLEHLPSAQLILCDEAIGAEQTASDIYQYLDKVGLHVPMIILGTKDESRSMGVLLAPDMELKYILKGAASLLGITAKEMAEKIVPDFMEFPLRYFKMLNFTNCAVYNKMEADYDLLFDANRSISQEEIKKVEESGAKGLWVLASDRLKFTNFYTTQIKDSVKRKKMTSAQRVQITAKAMQMIGEHVNSLGLDEFAVEVADGCINNIFKLTKEKGGMARLLNLVLNNSESFQYMHGQLTAYVCCQIIQGMDWGSEEQQEKIVFISFFHDIVLTQDELVEIHSDYELEKSDLTEKEKDLVSKHASLASGLMQKYPRAPMGADIIIRQHHGSKTGIGLKNTVSADLSPLAIVFIIGESFVHYFLKNQNNYDHDRSIEYLRQHFGKGNRAKTIIDYLDKFMQKVGPKLVKETGGQENSSKN